LQCVAVCCSVLQCVAVCCCVLQCVAVCCSVLQRVAVCCSVLQCVAVCCSVCTSTSNANILIFLLAFWHLIRQVWHMCICTYTNVSTYMYLHIHIVHDVCIYTCVCVWLRTWQRVPLPHTPTFHNFFGYFGHLIWHICTYICVYIHI